MKRTSVTAAAILALVITGACSKKQPETQAPAQTAAVPAQPEAQSAATPNGETTPEAATPNDLPATVMLTDGTSYKGVLLSKQGTQMTFQGENGATRTFDSRDVKSIRFGEAVTPVPKAAAGERAHRPAPQTTESAQATPPAPVEPVHAPAPPPRRIVIPSGTNVSVRTNEAIDAKTAKGGQTFSAEITQSVVDESGEVAIPRGAPATLVIKQASAGKVKSNELVLDMHSVSVNGHEYRVEASDVMQKGKDGVGANKRTAIFSGGGAALGAVIGAIAGGGKGAAIGAASGAAAGVGGQVFTRGSVKVPAETILTFRLEAPLELEAQ